MQAGFIAVPLSAPVPGSHDERISAVVTDTSPTVVLTTSAVFDIAAQYVDDGAAVIAVISVDNLDLDARAAHRRRHPRRPGYRLSAVHIGVHAGACGGVITHRNLLANFEQMMAGLLRQRGAAGRHDRVVAALLPRHGIWSSEFAHRSSPDAPAIC